MLQNYLNDAALKTVIVDQYDPYGAVEININMVITDTHDKNEKVIRRWRLKEKI